MTSVTVKNGNIDQALKQLKFKMKNSGVFDIVKEKQEYTKKSVRKHKQKLRAKYKQQEISKTQRS